MRPSLIAFGILHFGLPANAGSQPTATEIFHLRTECGKLGKELLQDNETKYANVYATSKYDEKINRCFVMLQFVFLKEKKVQLYLYDGQGGGLIAMWSDNTAQVKGENVEPSVARDYIMRTMKDRFDGQESPE